MKNDYYAPGKVKTVIGVFVILAVSAITAAGVCAQLPDVGMVIRLTGKVSYWHGDAKDEAATVQTFMKIRQNDCFSLSPHGVVQLVYFSNGRKETWTGPGVFKTGETWSEAVNASRAFSGPKVASLPQVVADQVKRVSPLVDPSKLHRSGGVQIRGDGSKTPSTPLPSVVLTEEEKKEVDTAKETYRSVLAKVDPDDIIPELYLFSVLADYDQFEEMKRLIDLMRQKQPDNAGIDRLAEWLKEQVQ